MTYYAKYFFRRKPETRNCYILETQEGQIRNLELLRYIQNGINDELGISNKEYIYFGVPKNPSIRRYFSHTFEGKGHKPITSTEALNNQNRTFGDSKQLGTIDLLLFEFSEDMLTLTMWAVKNSGASKVQKLAGFNAWCRGEPLEPLN